MLHRSPHRQEFFPGKEQAEATAPGVASVCSGGRSTGADVLRHQWRPLRRHATVTVQQSLDAVDDMNNAGKLPLTPQPVVSSALIVLGKRPWL